MTVVINGTTGITNPNSMTIGNGGGSVATNTAVGTSALAANTTGADSVAVGYQAGYSNTTGNDNTIVGVSAGRTNTTGGSLTAIGRAALYANTTGNYNTALGMQSLASNTTASNNNAVGYQAMYSNTTGASNVAIGQSALYSNTTASNNTVVGHQAGYANTTGNVTVFGAGVLRANTTGVANCGFGGSYSTPLESNTTGSYNTAYGDGAMRYNTTASNNTAVGYQAGYNNATGANLTAFGYRAGWSSTGDYGTFIGKDAGYYTTGTYSTFVGPAAGYLVTTGAKNTILGNYSGNQGGLDIRTSSNYIVLSDGDGNPRAYWNGSGNIFFPNVRNSAGAYAARFASGTGELTFDASSARYKDNIRDSKYGLADVLNMRSAMFEYKEDGRTDVGFIAEEVDLVIPELVIKDEQGRPNAVSYDRVGSVLLKAIQELNAKVEAQAAEIATLKGN